MRTNWPYNREREMQTDIKTNRQADKQAQYETDRYGRHKRYREKRGRTRNRKEITFNIGRQRDKKNKTD